MSTSKARVQAYVGNDLYWEFEQERLRWSLSQSQAIERILSERYRQDAAKETLEIDQVENLEREITTLRYFIEEISDRVDILEKGNELRGKPKSDPKGEPEGESKGELESELKGKSRGELDSELKGELEGESKSESKSELDSELKGELEGESKSELEGELEGESKSELEGESKSELEGESVKSDLSQSELESFVIYTIDKEIEGFRYWAGFERGFIRSIDHAKRYKSLSTLKNPMQKIQNDDHYRYFKQQPERFELRYSSVRYLVENNLI